LRGYFEALEIFVALPRWGDGDPEFLASCITLWDVDETYKLKPAMGEAIQYKDQADLDRALAWGIAQYCGDVARLRAAIEAHLIPRGFEIEKCIFVAKTRDDELRVKCKLLMLRSDMRIAVFSQDPGHVAYEYLASAGRIALTTNIEEVFLGKT